jgi:hypothetical protein
MLRFVLCSRWYGRGLVELYFVCLLAWEGFVNTCLDSFCVLAGIEGVWLIQVGIHYVSSVAWNGFGQHTLRNILSSLAWEEFGLSKLRYILSSLTWE